MNMSMTRQQLAEVEQFDREHHAAHLLHLLDAGAPGDWKIVETPEDVRFALAVTVRLMVGHLKVEVTRSGGEYMPSRRWDVRFWIGSQLMLGSCILFVESALINTLKRNMWSIVQHHDIGCAPPAWCVDVDSEQDGAGLL